MRATRHMVSLVFGVSVWTVATALLLVSCSGDSESQDDDDAYDFCPMPAPLYGEYDERAPGYLVTLSDGVNPTEEVMRLADEYPIEVRTVLEFLPGFSASMSDETRDRLRCEPSIASVEHDSIASPVRP